MSHELEQKDKLSSQEKLQQKRSMISIRVVNEDRDWKWFHVENFENVWSSKRNCLQLRCPCIFVDVSWIIYKMTSYKSINNFLTVRSYFWASCCSLIIVSKIKLWFELLQIQCFESWTVSRIEGLRIRVVC